MDHLTYADMNSLNAIIGYLRCIGEHKIADVLFNIQVKATHLLKQQEVLNRGDK